MDTVEERLEKLKPLGAGDADCAECLQMNLPAMVSMALCKKCIADTPAFSDLVERIMTPPNAEVTGA